MILIIVLAVLVFALLFGASVTIIYSVWVKYQQDMTLDIDLDDDESFY